MDLVGQVTDAVLGFLLDIATNPYNLAILAGTFCAVWVMKPIVHELVWHQGLGKFRVAAYGAARVGKRLAATMWCSIAVWVPGLQPELCGAEPVADCQTTANRILAGVVLGVFLTGSYAVVMSRLPGRKDRSPYKVKCLNCRKTSRVDDLKSPCPCCGDALHELKEIREKA